MADDSDDFERFGIDPAPAPGRGADIAARALLALLTGGAGPFGAAAGQHAALPVATLLQGAISEWQDHRARQADQTTAEACDESGLEPEQLINALLRDSKCLLLLRDAIEAAADTDLEAKVKVLGRALASGALATDDARIDEERLFVRTFAELESPHVQLLLLISRGTARLPRPGQRREISERQLGRGRLEAGQQAALLQPLLQVLQRNGLIRRSAMGAEWGEGPETSQDDTTNQWAVTAFGADVLGRLEAAGAAGHVEEVDH